MSRFGMLYCKLESVNKPIDLALLKIVPRQVSQPGGGFFCPQDVDNAVDKIQDIAIKSCDIATKGGETID